MQPIIAIETSTPLGGVAVGRGAELLAEVVVGMGTRHAEALLPAIDFALRRSGVEREDIGGVVVAAGPGSFTGVRIAGATAKALARTLEVPLYAYSSLAALAAGAGCADRAVCALFDARRGEVYGACYRFPGFGALEELAAPAALPVGELLARVSAHAPIYIGEGAWRYREEIEATGGVILPAHLSVPRPAALLWLRELAPEAGRVADPAGWEPLYLRSSGAERGVAG